MGVPGDGPLTAEQIKAWLATPGVHETLEVSLPFGLSLAADQITGLDENPLTRAKIELGRQLYFDPRLSSDSTISCASCHSHTQGFTAQTQFGVGVRGQTGNRNSPVSYNRILSGAQFWDGRAASLEDQAVGPIANPIEMANTHEECVACIAGIDGYKLQFTAVFGPDSINIDNVGKAIASFERAIVTGPAPYDYFNALKPFLDQFPEPEDLENLKEDDPETYARFLEIKAESDAHPMTDSAKRGLELFFSEKSNCTACHAGANFTDEKYHNLGVGMDAENPDLGRFEVTGDEKDKGAFKTPTIRNVEFTAPYMHDGSQKTLEEVVEWYAKGGHPNPWLSDKIKKLDLTAQDKADLVEFMRACTGDFPKVNSDRLPE
ncbi:MAG: c-type cytochrome [Planctomyces sp.]|nr:c-type cytochrome [Planctomyces sp.]